MVDITFKRKKKLKRSSTLSMHVDSASLDKFRDLCVHDFGIVYTEVIRNFIEDTISGKIKINVIE